MEDLSQVKGDIQLLSESCLLANGLGQPLDFKIIMSKTKNDWKHSLKGDAENLCQMNGSISDLPTPLISSLYGMKDLGMSRESSWCSSPGVQGLTHTRKRLLELICGLGFPTSPQNFSIYNLLGPSSL